MFFLEKGLEVQGTEQRYCVTAIQHCGCKKPCSQENPFEQWEHKKFLSGNNLKRTRIVPAKLRNQAGIVGAAVWAAE